MGHAFSFFCDTYATERLKTLSVWSQFRDADLGFRPEPRARTPLEHMVHQCVSEDFWFRTPRSPFPSQLNKSATEVRRLLEDERRPFDAPFRITLKPKALGEASADKGVEMEILRSEEGSRG